MYKEVFASRLKKEREDIGYSQRDVTAMTGISQPILSNLENGKREPSLENLGILATLYGKSVDYFLGKADK